MRLVPTTGSALFKAVRCCAFVASATSTRDACQRFAASANVGAGSGSRRIVRSETRSAASSPAIHCLRIDASRIVPNEPAYPWRLPRPPSVYFTRYRALPLEVLRRSTQELAPGRARASRTSMTQTTHVATRFPLSYMGRDGRYRARTSDSQHRNEAGVRARSLDVRFSLLIRCFRPNRVRVCSLDPNASLPQKPQGFRSLGEVDSTDYETIAAPAVKRMLERHPKIRLLHVLDERFTGYTAGGAWQDAVLGLAHPRSFERIAVVSDSESIRRLVTLAGWAIPGELKLFPNREREPAEAWAIEGLDAS
jgi:hypothetical protein